MAIEYKGSRIQVFSIRVATITKVSATSIRFAAPFPEAALLFPFEEEFAEALDGRGIVVFVPDENQGDAEDRFEEDKFLAGTRSDDGFGDHADARAGFDVKHDGANEAGGMGEARDQPGLAATGDDGIVKANAFAPREDDERFAGERGPGQGLPADERVIRGNDDAETLFVKRNGSEADFFVDEDRAGKSGGETTFGNHFPDALGGAFLEVDGDAGEPLAVIAEKRAEEWLGGRADVTEAKFTLLAGGGAADATGDVIDLVQKEANLVEQNRSRWGQAHHVAGSLQDFGAQGAFKLLDGTAKGWLGDMETLGCFGETEFLSDRLEVAQMPQVHNSLSTVMLIRYNEDSQELFPLRREVRVLWMGRNCGDDNNLW
jgi:hypothetical protein